LFKLFHMLITNKINYALLDGIKNLYYKTPIYLELMLKSQKKHHKKIPLINNCSFKNNFKVIFQRFIKKYRRSEYKKKGRSLIFFNKTLAFQMRDFHFLNVLKNFIPQWIYISTKHSNLFNNFFTNHC
jgi:hypothetical protein